MANHNDPTKHAEDETIVISGPAGQLTGSGTPPNGTATSNTAAVTGADAAVSEAAHAEAGQTTLAHPDDVEYEPLIYTDPGEVTEQFDHLATRDPESMERLPEAPSASTAAAVEAEMATEFERETLALTSANELGFQNPEASTHHAAETVEELGAESALRTDGLKDPR